MSEQDPNLNHTHFPLQEEPTERCPFCKRKMRWDPFKLRYKCICGLVDKIKSKYDLGIITFGGKI